MLTKDNVSMARENDLINDLKNYGFVYKYINEKGYLKESVLEIKRSIVDNSIKVYSLRDLSYFLAGVLFGEHVYKNK